MSAFRKDHIRIGRSFGIFLNGCAQFVFDVRLQRLADIDVLSRDLIAHVRILLVLAITKGRPRPVCQVLLLGKIRRQLH
jgi:hypothetical protein